MGEGEWVIKTQVISLDYMAKAMAKKSGARRRSPIRIGLTGSLASGKTTLLKAFKAQGFQVLSADEVVHEVYKENSIELESLRKNCLNSHAALNRLEDFIHPIVYSKVVDGLKKSRKKMAIEIPLLFEVGLHTEFDLNLFVYAPKSDRRKRAIKRGMKASLFDFLDSRQMTAHKKSELADFVLHNHELKKFKKQSEKLIELIKKKPSL